MSPELTGIVIGVGGTTILLLLGVVGKFVWAKFAKIDEVAKSQNEIVNNYLSRFDDQKDHTTAENQKTRDMLNALRLDITANYVRKDELGKLIRGEANV